MYRACSKHEKKENAYKILVGNEKEGGKIIINVY
jgi:hypothetical protein